LWLYPYQLLIVKGALLFGFNKEFWLIGTYSPNDDDANVKGAWAGIPSSILISFKLKLPDNGKVIIGLF
jgi:hypothetical protein